MKNKEDSLQIAISTYLKLNYPNLLFNSSLDGFKLTIGQAIKAKKMKSGKGWPDIFIAQPNNLFHGLFIELKIESPYKKDGSLKKNEHLQEQENMHEKLRDKGYHVCFSWNFEMTKEIIDIYLK